MRYAPQFFIRPTVLQETPETLPVIEVRLAPPSNPFPTISATIADLESKREALEKDKMSKLRAGYNRALQSAEAKIGDAVGSMVKFLQENAGSKGPPASFLVSRSQAGFVEGPSVKVKLSPVAKPDASITTELEAIEAKRSSEEAEMLDRAAEEMSELTDIVVVELKKSLQQQMGVFFGSVTLSFLEVEEQGVPASLPPKQANVRIGTSETPYPTVVGLAHDMEVRRNIAEHLLRQKVLELELKLLEAENDLIKQTLEKALGSVLAQRIGSLPGNFLALHVKFEPTPLTEFHGKSAATSDYQLNLHPPDEDTHDILEALDSATALESATRAAEDGDYAAVKQSMLNAEKAQIQ